MDSTRLTAAAPPVEFVPGSLHGRPSASQRREALLLATREHLMSVIAVLVTQLGGTVIVPAVLLQKQYNVAFKADGEGNIAYKVTPIEETPVEAKDTPT